VVDALARVDVGDVHFNLRSGKRAQRGDVSVVMDALCGASACTFNLGESA
jgi:hypothetical protein